MNNISKNEKITYDICKMAVESVKLYYQIAKDEQIKFNLYNILILLDIILMAEEGGFEPPRGVNPNTLSRRAP